MFIYCLSFILNRSVSFYYVTICLVGGSVPTPVRTGGASALTRPHGDASRVAAERQQINKNHENFETVSTHMETHR